MTIAAKKFPIGLAIASAVITGLAPLAAVCNVYFSADTRADSINLAWPYANVALASVIMLLWPAASMMDRRGMRLFDLIFFIAALPAMLLAQWLSSASAVNVFQSLVFQIALATAMTGTLLWSGASHARQLLVAVTAAALALALPLLTYLQLEFLGGSSAWSSISPLVASARLASGGSETVVTLIYFILGIAMIALSAAPRKS